MSDSEQKRYHQKRLHCGSSSREDIKRNRSHSRNKSCPVEGERENVDGHERLTDIHKYGLERFPRKERRNKKNDSELHERRRHSSYSRENTSNEKDRKRKRSLSNSLFNSSTSPSQRKRKEKRKIESKKSSKRSKDDQYRHHSKTHQDKYKKRSYSLSSASSFDSDSQVLDHHRKKKHKNSKKHKKRHNNSDRGPISYEYGKYGILQECDQWSKKQEFQLWLMEIKGIGIEGLQPWEEANLFSDYMEDYNTATLPHEKYYNLEKWEKQYANQPVQPKLELSMFDDERQRNKEIQASRQQQKFLELRVTYNSIKADSEKVDAMKEQKALESQMKALFRMGRIEEAQKIRQRLKPDKEHDH